jgi:hypothetical protein
MTKGEQAALAWIGGMTLAPEAVEGLRAAGHDPRAALRRARQGGCFAASAATADYIRRGGAY